MVSLECSLLSTCFDFSKKAEYSKLPFGAYAQTTDQVLLSENATLLTIWKNNYYEAGNLGLGSILVKM